MTCLVQLRAMRRPEVSQVAQWERSPENEPFIIPWSVERHVAALGDPDLLHLMVEHRDVAVGFVLLAGLLNDKKSVEFRRLVIVDKGRGYGRGAVELVKRECFEHLKAHRLWLDVLETNDRARALYASSGFRVEGVRRENIQKGDGFASLVLMSMLSSEYERPPGRAPDGVAPAAEQQIC